MKAALQSSAWPLYTLLSCWDFVIVLVLLGSKSTIAEPLLQVMYLKYNSAPIDTKPVFNPMIAKYEATLDWKMEAFAVEAQPMTPAIIDNIHLCRVNADCQKEEQRVVPMDFSKKIRVEVGNRVLYKFDVLLQGVVKSYTLIVNRLEGSETTLRHLFLQGVTLDPEFKPEEYRYRALMEVTMELVQMEVLVADSGQTVFGEADYPVTLDPHSNITELQNGRPGNTRSPPQRLRRMRGQAFGEFQYPNKYLNFPVPLETSRLIHFQVISADGGHKGEYQLEVARGKCPTSEPLFDVDASKCVKFCNKGFYAEFQESGSRCKRCHESCVNCLDLNTCVQCNKPTRRFYYVLDNATHSCRAVERAIWVQHPQHVIALAIAAVSVLVFSCGLCAFCYLATTVQKRRGAGEKATRGYARAPPNQERHNLHGGFYAPVNLDDHDETGSYKNF
jgi:hypothetical protein